MNKADEFDDSEWELAPESAHPAAAAALSEPWYWDGTDEMSPFGNDTGADVLSLFQQWRQEFPSAAPTKFLKQLMEDWDIPDTGWDEMDATRLGRLRQADDYGLATRDDMIIALALGQAVVEGKIDPNIRGRAVAAVRRQLLPVMLDRHEPEQEEAAARFRHMLGVLEQNWPG